MVQIFPITFKDCGGIFSRRNFSGQTFSCIKIYPPCRGCLGGGGLLGYFRARWHCSTVVKLRKFGQAQCLLGSSELASHQIMGYAEPSTPQMVTRRVRLVNVLDLGSQKPSTKKMVTQGCRGGGSLDIITQHCTNQQH